MPLHPELTELLAAWTAANLEHIRRCKRLVADHRGPLDRHVIGRIVRRVGRVAGVPGVHPHRLRHTLATQANRGRSSGQTHGHIRRSPGRRGAPGTRGLTTSPSCRRLRVLSYRVTLDVPLQLAVFVSRLLAGHRRELGTRTGTRALTCWKQAVFALAWFRDRPDIRRLGQGFGTSQATAYRYLDEAVEVLAAKAPTLREALERAVEQGLPYLILDGTLIASDRCADKKTSRKGKEIDKWYSGKAHRPVGNVQGLAAPHGMPLWVSGALPGSTHDLTAARELVLPQARPT